MRVQCPGCHATLEVAAPSAEKRVACSRCGAVMIVRPPQPTTTTCPACGEAIAAGAALCVRCGLDLRTGTAVHTSVGAEEEPEEDEAPPSLPLRVLTFVGEWLPGLLRPHVVALSIVVGLIGLGVLAFGLALLALGALITCFMAGAIGVIIYAQAAVWLLDGELTWLVEALTNLDGPRWALFFALLVLPFVSVFLLVHVAMAAQ